ncbi:MAG: hypothetical protein RLY86_3785 [Pseudomonadota bacterium]
MAEGVTPHLAPPRAGSAADYPPFRERFPWIGPHLQTIRNTLRRPRAALAPGTDLSFPMADGTGDVLTGVLHQPQAEAGRPGDRPLVMLVHGLTGCADSFYVLGTAAAVLAAGYPVLRLNLRGAGPTARTCRQRYHAGRTGDLRRVLALLPPEVTAGGVVPVGYSLGGNAVLKLLGEVGQGQAAGVPLRAVAAISAPIDLAGASRCFLLPRNRPYHRWLLNRMKAETLALGDDLPPDLAAAVRQAASVWDFDDRVIGPWNGWSGAEEYYRVNNARQFLPAIPVPALIIHALDDPWIPGEAYTSVDWSANPMLTPLLSRGGGHVGFHGRGGVWHDRCLVRFLQRMG